MYTSYLDSSMARRRKTSTLDDLLAISIKIPLWSNLVIAGGTFGLLRYYGGSEFPVMPAVAADHLADAFAIHFVSLAAYIAQYIVPPIFVLGGALGWIRRKARERKFKKISSHALTGQAIRNLSWDQFEEMVGDAFRSKGYTVHQTERGADGGVDLVLNRGGELYLVQCKQWRAAKVGVQVVRELYGVMSARGAAGGFVVTSGDFTPDAFKFAKGTSVELVDGAALTQMFKSRSGDPIPSASANSDDKPLPDSAPEHGSVDPSAVALRAAKRLVCPRCGGAMTPRFGRNQSGGIRDRMFLGCLAFPQCRGTRQIPEASLTGKH